MNTKAKLLDFESKPFGCAVKGCGFLFTDLFFYARHLTSQHDIPINIMYLSFNNDTDFKNWKMAEEYRNNCMFTSTGSQSVYCCHRNVYIASSLAENENNPIDEPAEDENFFKSMCPSHMKIEAVDGHYHVIYVRSHFGYCQELKAIAISDETQGIVKSLSAQDYYDLLIVQQLGKELRPQNHTDSLITTRQVAEILKSGHLKDY